MQEFDLTYRESLRNFTEFRPEAPHPGKRVIFSDLDGALLDHRTYSHKGAVPSLQEIEKRKIPFVPMTSKPFSEVQAFLLQLSLPAHPIAVENGGGIFVPHGYFRKFTIEEAVLSEMQGQAGFPPRIFHTKDHALIELGTPYRDVRETLHSISRKTKIPVRGIGDMTRGEFASVSGLSIEAAERARQRSWQEGFLIDVTPDAYADAVDTLKKEIRAAGFEYNTGGRFHQIYQGGSKERAANILLQLYEREHGRGNMFPIGLGDSQADVGFLQFCAENGGKAFLIRNDSLTSREGLNVTGVTPIAIEGSAGWNAAVFPWITNIPPYDN